MYSDDEMEQNETSKEREEREEMEEMEEREEREEMEEMEEITDDDPSQPLLEEQKMTRTFLEKEDFERDRDCLDEYEFLLEEKKEEEDYPEAFMPLLEDI